MNRRLLVFFSDTHGGHKLSLMNPDVWLLEEADGELRPYQPQLSAMQRWLWSCYKADIAAVAELADGCQVDVCHVGDVTWGTRYPAGLVSSRLADQPIIAVANMAPWLALPNVASLRLIVGTDSHELGESSAPILVARELTKDHPDRPVGVLSHLLGDVDGVAIDAAHHGPHPGTRTWLKGNQLRYYCRSLMEQEIIAGREPPELVVRAHYHEYARETVRIRGAREYVTEIVVLPSYAGLTPYAQQATRSVGQIGCGLVVVEIADGRLREISPLVHGKDIRARVVL